MNKKILFTIKKALSIILILTISFQSNAQFLGSIVFAEDETSSASADISNLRIETDELKQIDTDSQEHSSAAIRLKSYVKALTKKNYRASERIDVVIANSTKSEKFTVSVKDPGGLEAKIEVQQENIDGEKVLEILPPQEFRPGKYTVEIRDSEGNIASTQDFLWGVLAINTNKSFYRPNETVKLSFAVLDEQGYMVCNADLRLTISTPEGKVDELTTESGNIKVNDQCSKKEFSLLPDFESEYKLGNSGKYNLKLIAETENGSYSISDSFEVKEDLPFEVERKTVTRIFPPETYPMEFVINANEDFKGTVTEVVPENFEITKLADTQEFNNIRTVSRATVQGRQVLGAKTDINLPVEKEREVTSVFGDVVEDPFLSEKYSQYGVEGHDGIDFAAPIGTSVIAVDSGTVALADENGDYGSTLVIEHEWGKSYYGHLSEFEVKVGDKIEKGERVALSGNTGLSTGPHLHFGLKPKENDTDNGYYGKIDPSPYLGLPDESSVLGASAVSDIKVKVISWDVDVKKGEKISLGYSYKTPPKSPQFYTLGTAKFFDENDGKVFEEGRAWQLAIDASNYAGRYVKTVEYSFGNSYSGTVNSMEDLFATDNGIGAADGWTTTAPTQADDGISVILEGTNINVLDAFVEFTATATAAATMTDLNINMSTCQGSVSTCTNAPVYRALPLLGNPTNLGYYINSAEINKFSVKANAEAAFDGISDSDWATGVETIIKTTATGAGLSLQTAKLVLTYESDFNTATHDEVKTVRFPLDSDVAGDTGSKRTSLAAAATQTFTYNANVPDLAADADILDVYFEIYSQISATASNGTLTARVESGTPTDSPAFDTITSTGVTSDFYGFFRPAVGANDFQPNTTQQLRLAPATNAIYAAGGELVVTYRYSTAATSQTETVRYFANQLTTSGSNAKNTATINPAIANTGASVSNIWARVQAANTATSTSLTVYGDIDNGGATSEKSNAYTLIFTGTEQIGQPRIIYDMTADAGSFVSGGNMTVSTQWSNTSGNPPSVEVFVTFTWSGNQGGEQTKSVEYYVENSRLGGTAGTTAQSQRNTLIRFGFPETATKTLQSAYIENYVTSSGTVSPTNLNHGINEDAIASNGTGFIGYATTLEGMSFTVLEDIESYVDVSQNSQRLIYNFNTNITVGYSPKTIVTYDVDFSQTGSTVPDKQIKTVEYSFGNSNVNVVTGNTSVYALDTGTGGTNGWTTTAPTQADAGMTVKINGTNIIVKQAWVEFRAQTTAGVSVQNMNMALSTCQGSVATCTNSPVYRELPLLGNPATVSYVITSIETNVFYVKANAAAAFDGLSDSDWSTGVETLLKTSVTAASNGHTAKLFITYESDYSSVSHNETKTVRFPLDSTNGTDTGSRQAQLAAGGNQDFDYTANIPDLASNSDIYDVHFEIYAQSGNASGALTARVVSASQTDSPLYPTYGGATGTTQGNNFIFRPTIGTNNFEPNTAQQINMTTTAIGFNALGGELVVTYKYSTGASSQTETIKYYANQLTTHGDGAKNTATIAPVISNTGFSVTNIYAKVTAHNTAASNLQVYGDIDSGGGVTEKSNTFVMQFASEIIASNTMIYDMTADAASFASGGNMTVSTDWSNTSGGAPSVEVYITFTWDGDQGGTQTKTAEYYIDNSRLGGTAGTTTQEMKSTALNLFFPESVTKTINSAYVQNWVTSSDATTPVNINHSINEDFLVSNGTGFIGYTHSGEAITILALEDINSFVDPTESAQALTYNFISDGTAGTSPKAIITYDAAFAAITAQPTGVTLYPQDGSNQIAFNNNRQNSSTPTFRLSATHTSTFDRFQLELNTAADFSGTSYTQTFSGTYSSATEYNATATSLSPSLPTTNGVTYYARARASADAGTGWSSWSSGTWSYTYKSSGTSDWFQTTDEQFSTGTLTDTETTGSDSVGLVGSGSVIAVTHIAHNNTSSNIVALAGVSVTAGRLYLLSVGAYEASGTTPTSISASGGGLSFTQITQTSEFNGGSGPKRLYLMRALATSTETISITVTVGGTVDFSAAILDEIQNVDTSGTNGSGAIAQSVANSGTTANPSVTLSSFSSTNNATFGTMYNYAGVDPAQGSGFTELYDGHLVDEPSSEWKVANDTSVDWTQAADDWGAIGVELVSVAATTGTVMSPEIDYDWGIGVSAWDEFTWSEDQTNGTVSMQLYYTSSTACDTIVPDGALSGNSSGFSTGPIDISGLNTTTYNRICLKATLNDSGGTPYLQDWTISWGNGVEVPSLSQLMRHGRWFNTSGVIQPFTF